MSKHQDNRRDDEAIEHDRTKVAQERKQNWKRDMLFVKGSGSGGGVGTARSSNWLQSEVSELTQPEVLEVQIYDNSSSKDIDFTSKLVSPRDKVFIHRISTKRSIPKTPPGKITKSSTKCFPYVRVIRDLNLQIINQDNVIAELRKKKLSII